jgi:lipopolysaccharide heptosyltransferase II
VRFKLMRVVDKSLGGLLCRLVAFLRWVCRRHIRRVDHPPPPEPANVHEILVIKFLGLGSILQATPLFEALKRHYPKAKITLLTFRANRALADLNIGIDQLETVDTSRLWRFVGSNIRALWRLRRKRFDLVLNLEFFATYAALMTALAKKRFAMGFGGFANYRNRFFHDFVSYDSGHHVQQKFLAFARRLGYTGPTPPLARLRVPQSASVVGEIEKREEFQLGRDDYTILVNINTGEMAPHRRWPVEHFQALVEQLLKRPRVRCMLIGGPGDRAAVDRFQASLSRPDGVVNLAGRISIPELVALMQTSNLYLGNDSGPLHFAACVGLPVLAMFGPESPDVYGPPVTPWNTVLHRAEPCGPCLNVYTDKHSPCGDNICLKRIGPAEVLEVLESTYLDGWLASGLGRRALPVVQEAFAVGDWGARTSCQNGSRDKDDWSAPPTTHSVSVSNDVTAVTV